MWILNPVLQVLNTIRNLLYIDLKKENFINEKFKKVFWLLILVSFSSIFGEEEERKIRIEWRKVPYAEAYIIQIRNNQKQNILEKKTKSNTLDLSLPPGKYEQRIGVINKFGRLERYSDWVGLKILVVKEPELPPPVNPSKPRKSVTQLPGKDTLIPIEGKNFVPDTKFTLKKGNKQIPTESKVMDDNKAEIMVPEGYLEEGDWDLVIENPLSKKTVVPKFARVDDKTDNVVSSRENDNNNQDENNLDPIKDNSYVSEDKKPIDKVKDAERDRYSPVWRSALAPGWGHFYMDKNRKGYIYSGLFTLGFLYLYNSRENLLQAESNYNRGLTNNILLQALNPGNAGVFAFTNIANESSFRNFRQANQDFNIASLLVFGFYIFQLWDTYSDSEEWILSQKTGWKLDIHNLPASNESVIINSNPNSMNGSYQMETLWKLTYKIFF